MIDPKLKEAIYAAITQSSGNQKAIEEAMEQLHTEVCTEVLYAVFQDPIIAELDKEAVIEEINPILAQVAEELNEVLLPYMITLKPWDALALAKRVEYLESGGVN